jgi:hypothetical protein
MLCFALLLTTVEQVQAEFITFNGTAPDGGATDPGSSYSEGGFNFQFGDGIQAFRDNDSDPVFYRTLAGFDDDVLELAVGDASFVLTHNSGLLFDLRSVIISAGADEGMGGIFIFTGTVDGGEISSTVTAHATSITNVIFGGFTNLISLKVTGSHEHVFMDNLEVSVSDVSAVPEPTTIALWGIGSLSMGLIARRRRAKEVAAV